MITPRPKRFPYLHKDPEAYRSRVSSYYQFKASGHDATLGYMLPTVVSQIDWLLEFWTVDPHAQIVTLKPDSVAERNLAVSTTLDRERDKRTFAVLSGWRNELYSVYGLNAEVLVSIERAGCALFGVPIYGIHMTAYTMSSSKDNAAEPKIWVAKCAESKQTYPGMLDNTVGGGMPTGEEPLNSLVRECSEEASIPESYVRSNARACGTVTYFDIRDERAGGETGLLQPECIYVYDLLLEEGMTPRTNDGEAEKFMLWSVEELREAMMTGRFKTNCALVLIDFFIRHGLIVPERERDYIEIVSRLHRNLEFGMR